MGENLLGGTSPWRAGHRARLSYWVAVGDMSHTMCTPAHGFRGYRHEGASPCPAHHVVRWVVHVLHNHAPVRLPKNRCRYVTCAARMCTGLMTTALDGVLVWYLAKFMGNVVLVSSACRRVYCTYLDWYRCTRRTAHTTSRQTHLTQKTLAGSCIIIYTGRILIQP